MPVDHEYVDAVRAATRAAATVVLPDRSQWLRENFDSITFAGGRIPDRWNAETVWGDFVGRERAMKFLDVFQPAMGSNLATGWCYSHEPGPPSFEGELRGEAAIDSDTGPCLGDFVIVGLETFAGRERDFMSVLGRLARTGAMLVLVPLGSSGLLSRERETWLQDERGYVRALEGGCLFRPSAEGLDY